MVNKDHDLTYCTIGVVNTNHLQSIEPNAASSICLLSSSYLLVDCICCCFCAATSACTRTDTHNEHCYYCLVAINAGAARRAAVCAVLPGATFLSINVCPFMYQVCPRTHSFMRLTMLLVYVCTVLSAPRSVPRRGARCDQRDARSAAASVLSCESDVERS